MDKPEETLEISCQLTEQKLDQKVPPFLLDCREQKEFDLVHINGATLLPMSEIAERVDEIDDRKSDEIIVYCHHGARSLRVTRWLKSQGFENVKSMQGGIDEWARTIDTSLPTY